MTRETVAVYYNDNDLFVCAWLRNLIAAGHLPAGDVDERPIEEVRPDDVRGFTQCHFFAGIGGWPYALKLAGWPDDRPVWTGSCPCQPFSAAGCQAGHADARHLWPAWHRLIAECHPPTIFGEQVSSHLGRAWLTAVRLDLEDLGYGVGAADLCAAGVGAPHIRQRLWFVADSTEWRRQRNARTLGLERDCGAGVVDDPASARRDSAEQGAEGEARDETRLRRSERRRTIGSVAESNPWSNVDWLLCRDGKAWPVEPTIFPLAHGIPNRMGLLRGAGNAIVPQVAAAFVTAYLSLT